MSLELDKRGPFLLWQAMAMCLEESPPREQLRITPISLLDSPSLYLTKEEVAREERGKRVGIEEEEWLFCLFCHCHKE